MKIGAYQFAVTGSIKNNLEKIKKAVIDASAQNVSLLVFPECALTGYPPFDLADSAAVDFDEAEASCEQLQDMAVRYHMYLIVGMITKKEEKHYNSAVIFTPENKRLYYHKRALWGWDKNNFCKADAEGIFEIAGLKIGVRICYEIRFPEFFRELYRGKTDLNIVLFYDVSEEENEERYELIKAHIRTRAVENVCHILTVDAVFPYQTAPTALYDKSGKVLTELKRNEEALLIYDLNDFSLDFGEQGRKEVSDWLLEKQIRHK